MIWIFVRRDYGALECTTVAGRSVLLKARSQWTQPLMAAIRTNCRRQELKAEALAQPLA
jgi:hypothetical protein